MMGVEVGVGFAIIEEFTSSRFIGVGFKGGGVGEKWSTKGRDQKQASN